jgi:hypothetical protein
MTGAVLLLNGMIVGCLAAAAIRVQLAAPGSAGDRATAGLTAPAAPHGAGAVAVGGPAPRDTSRAVTEAARRSARSVGKLFLVP